MIGKDARWALLASTSEQRHIHDLAYIAHRLILCGVPPEQIAFFSDFGALRQEVDSFQFQASKTYPIKHFIRSSEWFSDASFLGVAVSGHGSGAGLAHNHERVELRSHEFYKAIRDSGAMSSLVVLGQCYAGIFNFSDVGYTPPPQIVVVGATGFHQSLSIDGLKLSLPIPRATDPLSSWNMNYFLVSFFDALHLKKDVDGDGVATVSDLFRYAASNTNDMLRLVKSNLSKSFDEWCLKEKDGVKWKRSQAEKKTKPSEIAQKERLLNEAAESEKLLNVKLSNFHTHQEPWLLNARIAMGWSV